MCNSNIKKKYSEPTSELFAFVKNYSNTKILRPAKIKKKFLIFFFQSVNFDSDCAGVI